MKFENRGARLRTGWLVTLVLGTFCFAVGTATARDRAPSKHVNERSSAVSLHRSGQPLPAGAQFAISAAIGRDQATYHAKAIPNGFQVKNPQSKLQATFTRQGVRVESGKTDWGMNLEAFGTAGKLRAVASANPRASGNRVEYRRGRLTEWYVNGPAGLEQGFTIRKAPKGSKDGTIELALGLSGNLAARVDAAKTGLILSGGQGQAELRYTGLAARDAAGRKLRSWLEVRGEKLLVEVATVDANYPLVVDPYIQVAKLTASDGAAGDHLGWSVSMSADGSTLVVGAPNAKVGSNFYQGAVYVFVKPLSGWADSSTFAAKLTIFDGAAGDSLGQSVSVSADGSTVAAGAESAKVGSNSQQGAVYVFTRSGSGWAPAAKLTASDGAAGDYLGQSVSVSADGSTVVAGAESATVGSNFYQGAAYAFARPGENWSSETQAAKLTASDGATYEHLGWSVSMSADGSTVVAGAPYADVDTVSGTNFYQGAVYVFVKSGWTSWTDATEAFKLTASDGATYDYLGYSVSVSADGSTVVAGVPYADIDTGSGTNINQGAVYVFVGSESPGGTETAKLTASDGAAGEDVGYSVSISADSSTVVAGAPYATVGSNLYQGKAYVFLKPPDGWTSETEDSRLAASDGAAYGNQGWSVSVSADGSTVVAGAPYADIDTVSGTNINQGVAYVFSNSMPFSSFDVGHLKITLGPPSSFDLNSSFILGGPSDGINPVTEPVRLQIGTMSLTIPPGSFQQNKNGDYSFSGVVDDSSVDVLIQDQGANAYAFKVKCDYANLTGTANPVVVTLAIGDDSGAWIGTLNIH
jgi:trimeric autotransporter adhesin